MSAWMEILNMNACRDDFGLKKNCAADAPVKLDPVVEANRALLHKRSQVGIAKYGTTLHDARLSERELIVHALEESLDLANYLQAQLQRHDRMADDGK